MATSMRAMVLKQVGGGRLERADLTRPEPGPGQVLIEVAEFCAQILQVGLVVENLDAVKYHWHVDHEGDQQGNHAKQNKIEGYPGT